jgi:hypothetical protein
VKKLVACLLVVSATPGVSAQLEVQVAQNQCPSGFNPLVSVDRPVSTTGNPGVSRQNPPTDLNPLYKNQICVGGVQPPTIRESCSRRPGFYLYSRETDAHFSNTSVYPLEVCTGRLTVELRSLDTDRDGELETQNPCRPGEEPLFSVSNYTNAHIASPSVDFYPFKACGSLRPFAPESVEVRLSLDSNQRVESDDVSLNPGDEKNSFEYPYIASSDGSSVIGLVTTSANTTIRRVEDGKNTLILTAPRSEASQGETSSTSIFVPFTRGGFDSINRRDDAVMNRELLGVLNPTFGFPNPDRDSGQSNYYRGYLDSDFNLTTNMSLEPGSYQLELEKTGEDGVAVRME